MPTPYPEEFRRDVIAVAGEGGRSRAQVARSFGISESCLPGGWVRPVIAPTRASKTPLPLRWRTCQKASPHGCCQCRILPTPRCNEIAKRQC